MWNQPDSCAGRPTAAENVVRSAVFVYALLLVPSLGPSTDIGLFSPREARLRHPLRTGSSARSSPQLFSSSRSWAVAARSS